jgi:2-oxoglutarate ferredoxin oxidoreductase subunit alpha
MVNIRQEKIERIAHDIPEAVVEGEIEGDILILSWGSTYGAAKTAFEKLKLKGHALSFLNLRHLNPFPRNLGEIVNRFERIVVPELNMGQLQFLLQAKYLKPVIGIHKVQGKPFKSIEIEQQIESLLSNKEILV